MRAGLVFSILLLPCFQWAALSQSDTTRVINHGFYIEALGTGGYGSINYEGIWPVVKNLKIAGRAGMGIYHLTDFSLSFNPDVNIPLSINGLYGNTNNLELGFGQTLSNTVKAGFSNGKPTREFNIHANFTIGYRYQKEKGGLIFRICYSPIIEFYKYYRHWGGISIGYGF
ncbi:MAG: hypothetical protein K9G76_07255 [Bacteroidales bacterium]|nr:hypothetical protein [Bacteroidales bacterium]MCF8404584.1 hypothetical protein [Bacteroidales bacterium]